MSGHKGPNSNYFLVVAHCKKVEARFVAKRVPDGLGSIRPKISCGLIFVTARLVKKSEQILLPLALPLVSMEEASATIVLVLHKSIPFSGAHIATPHVQPPSSGDIAVVFKHNIPNDHSSYGKRSPHDNNILFKDDPSWATLDFLEENNASKSGNDAPPSILYRKMCRPQRAQKFRQVV